MSEAASTVERRLEIVNELGIHARPATKLVQLANKFSSEITIEKDGQTVNGKSIMGVLMLVAARGSFITVRCVGEDAEGAMKAIEELVKSRFGEE